MDHNGTGVIRSGPVRIAKPGFGSDALVFVPVRVRRANGTGTLFDIYSIDDVSLQTPLRTNLLPLTPLWQDSFGFSPEYEVVSNGTIGMAYNSPTAGWRLYHVARAVPKVDTY